MHNTTLKRYSKEEIKAMFGDLTLDSLPSKDSTELLDLIQSFTGRKDYIRELGYVLYNKEFAKELQKVLNEVLKNGDSFLELEAGTGSFTMLLNNLGFDGYGITLEIKENHWGMDSASDYYQKALSNNQLFLSSLEDWKIKVPPKLIIANWIPYNAGDEVIEFFDKLKIYPEYFLTTDEDMGGCVANDHFFEWLDLNYKAEYTFRKFYPFDCIHDRPVLHKFKG
jgi:hypothetical protein